MLLYDSLTARQKPFTLPSDRPISLYVCGITPYDTTHIGHARTYLVFDVLTRYLRWQGAEVRYCQNVTDVDDPLFERANRDGIPWQDLAQREVDRFLADCTALNIAPPTYFPKSSTEIETMLPLVGKLLALGHAYEREGNVYFAVQSYPSFGAMARQDYAGLLASANQRGNDPSDPLKRDPLDFVLWQTCKHGEPTWESPWGLGRPGWHIECSAMATRYLGPQLDFHGGGSDLIFPHHACEIAQTEPVTGLQPFAQFWVHTGMVYLDGEKMSKSLGNLVFVREAVKEHTSNALRWYLLSFPYREAFSYERKGVREAELKVAQLTEALQVKGGSATPLDLSRAREALTTALATDLKTPLALEVLAEMAQRILSAASEGANLQAAQATLADLATMLGFQCSPSTT